MQGCGIKKNEYLFYKIDWWSFFAAVCHEIDQWPKPVPGEMLNLPFMGMVLHVRVPTKQDKPGRKLVEPSETVKLYVLLPPFLFHLKQCLFGLTRYLFETMLVCVDTILIWNNACEFEQCLRVLTQYLFKTMLLMRLSLTVFNVSVC